MGLYRALVRLGRALVATVVLAVTGCALSGVSYPPPAERAFPVRVLLTDVPFFAQKAFHCGPAALAMALQHSGVPAAPDELVQMVYVPDRRGSLQSGMIGAARRHGRLAYPIRGLDCLLRAAAGGHPVIVLQNLGLNWLQRWHYAVVVGYDLPQKQIILHTGTRAGRRVRLATFLATWRRADSWGFLVIRPNRMPVCAQEQDYLQAALGLQLAGQPAAAVEAFQSAAGQWPRSFEAQMGLGNALYGERDLPGAERAFRAAVVLKPDDGDALNNLAHVLAESNRLDEAVSMIRRAFQTDGRNHETYRRTLQEIEDQLPP